MTTAQYREFRKTGKVPEASKPQSSPATTKAPVPTKRPNPRPKQTPGKMNKTEAAFAREYLDPKVASGEMVEYRFEPFSLKLANNTHYRPDFLAIYPDRMVIYEVKGTHVEDDAMAKWKIAADQFWFFEFQMVKIGMSRGAIKEMDWREYKL
jgi:hypothetical protein